MPSRFVWVSAAAVAIFAALGVSFHRAGVAASLATSRTEDLMALREQLADLDRDTVIARHDPSKEQALDADWRRLKTLQLALARSDSASAELSEAGLDAALAQEEQTLGDFRAAQAALRSSESEFIEDTKELARTPVMDPRIADVLSHHAATSLALDFDDRGELNAAALTFATMSVDPSILQTSPVLDEVMREARGLLELSAKADVALRRGLDNRAAETAVAKIASLFEQSARHATQQEAAERTALGLLVFGLMGLLVRAHRQLERRVVERTEQLTRAREQIVLSERMATVGSLAAGVAHEVNNPAAYIMTNAAFLLDELQHAQPEWKEGGELDLPPITDLVLAAQGILDGVGRISTVVKDLKGFSRESTEDEMAAVDVGGVVELSLRMASSELKTRARVTSVLAATMQIRGNASRLGQVFLNLFINAAHAMAGKKDAELRVTTRDIAGAVEISVTDSGSGMPAEVMKRIFEPFFTTKPVGVGTGLGLSICHSIIEKHGGHIEVKSTLGVGTTFLIRLPVFDGVQSQTPVKPLMATAA